MGKLLRKILNFIIRYIEQVFFILLFIWVGMSIFLIIKGYFYKPLRVIGQSATDKDWTQPESEDREQKRFSELIKLMKEPEPKEFYAAILKKRLFYKMPEEVFQGSGIEVPPGPELEVLRITPVRIPIKYMGFLELPGGGLSAQIESSVQIESSIVFVGDIVAGYKILEITKKYVKAMRADGSELIFNLLEEVVSEESETIIRDKKKGRVYKVRKGNMIDKKKVLDIKIGSVTLLNEDGTEEVLPLKK